VGFFILNQYLLIKQIMLEPQELKLFNKILSKLFKKYDDEYYTIPDYIEEIDELLGTGSYSHKEIMFGVFNFFTNVVGEDPFDYAGHQEENLLRNNVGDPYEILNGTGWIDKYYTLDTFIINPSKENKRKEPKSVYGDIQIEGDKIYLICDGWAELSILYNDDDRDTAERVLSEDWSDLYGWFDVDFDSDVWDNLDEKSLQHIKEYIKENNFIGRQFDGVPERYDEDPDGDGLREDMLLDNDLLGELIEKESMFGNLALELKNFYRWAYESASEDELSGDMKREVISVIGSKPEWDMVKSKKEGGSDKHVLKFDVTDKFMEFNYGYLEYKGEFPQDNESYFLNVIEVFLEWEGMLQTPDLSYFYPDQIKVSEHLNDNVLGNL
jgi:hypothetical protein